MLEVGVVIRVKLSVAFAADLANRLVLAGGCAAGVLVLNGNLLFGRERKAVSGLCTHDQLKAVFFRRICGCFYDTAVQTILNGRRKRTVIKSDKFVSVAAPVTPSGKVKLNL